MIADTDNLKKNDEYKAYYIVKRFYTKLFKNKVLNLSTKSKIRIKLNRILA